MNQANNILRRRTAELAATNRLLQRAITRRAVVEAALQESGVHYTTLLAESLKLQDGLRQVAHRALTAQEDERMSLSRELQDEIAQTLLGINVRLLSLKKEARTNSKGLKSEITSTQLMVDKLSKSMGRTARKLEDQ